jgi:hypothetical protein
MGIPQEAIQLSRAILTTRTLFHLNTSTTSSRALCKSLILLSSSSNNTNNSPVVPTIHIKTWLHNINTNTNTNTNNNTPAPHFQNKAPSSRP